VAEGFGNHESKIADLDGNGTLDILGKPYNWDTPRLDIWLNPAPPSRQRSVTEMPLQDQPDHLPARVARDALSGPRSSGSGL
jgi:hypothetical protein